MNRFDPDGHRYFIHDREVPSVTGIINEVLQIKYFGATEWHMERGRAIHRCAELIANGKDFDCDEQITGQVAAIREFFRLHKPSIRAVEQQVYSERYMYGGTFDLLCVMNLPVQGHLTLCDYKSSLSGTEPLQLAGYALAIDPKQYGGTPTHGLAIELCDSGIPKIAGPYELKKYVNKFLALRSVYSIKEEMGIISKKEKTT